MKKRVEYLQTCQVGVPDGEGDVEECGEFAIARIQWEDSDDWLYVCEEHLTEIEDEEEKEAK